MSIKASKGIHHPKWHDDPYKIAPLLRADGKTRCDKCDLSMVPFEELPAAMKDDARAVALDIIECNEQFRRNNDGRDI